MKIFDIISRKKKKSSIFNTEESYRFIVYQDGLNKEIIWNGTNYLAPENIHSKDGTRKLFKIKVTETKVNMNPNLSKGSRFFRYKLEEEIIKEKLDRLEKYWKMNINECQKYYSSYEEYIQLLDVVEKTKYIILDEVK